MVVSLVQDISREPTWVYQCFCSHGSLLYVGIARDVDRRLQQHHRKEWWPDVEYVLTDLYKTRFQALKVEAYWIVYGRPVHNIAGQTKLPDVPHPLVSRRDFARQGKRMKVTLEDAR